MQANNAEGTSPLSASGEGTTNAEASNNIDPVLSGTATLRTSIDENSTGVFGPEISATDANGDTLSFTTSDYDWTLFDLEAVANKADTVRLKLKTAQNFEAFAVPLNALALRVNVSDGNGGSDSVLVTVGVNDVVEKPTRPGSPTVMPVAGSSTELSVRWTTPANAGKPPITGYNLQYRKGTTGSFTTATKYQNISGTSTTITGLEAGASYQVQVQAINRDGNGSFSPSGTGRTSPPQKLAAPAGLRGDGHLVGNHITLRWDAVPNADSYDVKFIEMRCNADRCLTTLRPWTTRPNVSTTAQDNVELSVPVASDSVNNRLFRLEVQAKSSSPNYRASDWSNSKEVFTTSKPPEADVDWNVDVDFNPLNLNFIFGFPVLPVDVSITTTPPRVATAPLWGHLKKNSSSNHDFEFKVCAHRIPAGVTINPTDIETAIETWETATDGMVTTTLGEVLNLQPRPFGGQCFAPFGPTPTGDNEVIFAERTTVNLAGCIDNAPACWRSSTWIWVEARSLVGAVRGLPEIAEGTILIWNIPKPGGSESDWNRRLTGGCKLIENILIHEAGHALGIGWPINEHPTLKMNSIMSYRAPRTCAPQKYDIIAIEANYQSR